MRQRLTSWGHSVTMLISGGYSKLWHDAALVKALLDNLSPRSAARNNTEYCHILYTKSRAQPCLLTTFC